MLVIGSCTYIFYITFVLDEMQGTTCPHEADLLVTRRLAQSIESIVVVFLVSKQQKCLTMN